MGEDGLGRYLVPLPPHQGIILFCLIHSFILVPLDTDSGLPVIKPLLAAYSEPDGIYILKGHLPRNSIRYLKIVGEI